MSPLDVSQAIPIAAAAEIDRWLSEHGAEEPELIVAIYKKSSGKQLVTFEELLETSRSATGGLIPKRRASTTSATRSATCRAARDRTGQR